MDVRTVINGRCVCPSDDFDEEPGTVRCKAKISGGAIAGVIIGALALIGLSVFAGVMIAKKVVANSASQSMSHLERNSVKVRVE